MNVANLKEGDILYFVYLTSGDICTGRFGHPVETPADIITRPEKCTVIKTSFRWSERLENKIYVTLDVGNKKRVSDSFNLHKQDDGTMVHFTYMNCFKISERNGSRYFFETLEEAENFVVEIKESYKNRLLDAREHINKMLDMLS